MPLGRAAVSRPVARRLGRALQPRQVVANRLHVPLKLLVCSHRLPDEHHDKLASGTVCEYTHGIDDGHTRLKGHAVVEDLVRVFLDEIDRHRTGVRSHDVAVVLGSGWLPAVDALGEPTAELSTTDLPGFARPTVAGHAGRIRSVRAGDRNLLVLMGRTHLYEGVGVRPVEHAVRTDEAAGYLEVVLTNGGCGLDEAWLPVGAGGCALK